MTSPRFVRRWREGRRTRRRKRGRHSNYMEQVPGEGRVEVGKQKEFPAGKSSQFVVVVQKASQEEMRRPEEKEQ